jgi:hypothetical protein
MISKSDDRAVDTFLDQVEIEFQAWGVKLAREWLTKPGHSEFNPDGFFWRLRCLARRDDILAVNRAEQIATSSQIEICDD